MQNWHRLLASVLCSVLVIAATGPAAAVDLTWTGAGDGHSWNQAANWNSGVGPAPAYFDTLYITTTGTIDNVYRDTGTATYIDGSTWRGIVNLNQGTINMTARFETGTNGVFNIGDGILTGGLPDAIVNGPSAGWRFDRHDNGTYTVNIREDGQLSGTFLNYADHPGRKWVINVDGGSMTSSAAWNMSDGLGNDANQVNLAKGGTVNVGAVTVHEEVIHFQDATSASFTAAYGASFANIAAVNAAFGSTFTPSAGRSLTATDNGTSFTVAIAPIRIEVGGDNTIGEMHLTGTQQNEVYSGSIAGAKYVRVVQNVNETFQVAELQTFEYGTGTNLSLTGTATAESSDYGSTPDRVKDDNTDMAWGGGSVWHSVNTQGTWVQIELDAPALIETIHFWGRSDCCQSRQGDFNLIIEDASHNKLYNERIVGLGSTSPFHGSIPLASLVSADLVAMLSEIDTYVFELGSSDQIIVDNPNPAVFTTVLDLNDTTIEVELLGLPHTGTWQLLVADKITGSYDSLILPALGSGWTWDSSNLLVNGSLSLVPEPSTLAMLLTLGGIGLLGWRRRRRNT